MSDSSEQKDTAVAAVDGPGLLRRLGIWIPLIFSLHVLFVWGGIQRRLQEPLWWPLLAGWLLLPCYYRSSAGAAALRLGRWCRLLFLLDGLLLLLSVLRGSDWLAMSALATFTAGILLGKENRAGDRSLVRLSLLSFVAAGVPPFVEQNLWSQLTLWLAEVCSVQGAVWGWQNVLSGTRLLGPRGELSLEVLCGSGLCWTWVLSAGLWWALLQRRSVLQAVLLVVCACAIACVGLLTGGLWAVRQLSAGAESISVLYVQGMLLVPQLLLVLSADSLVLFLTSPMLRPELLEVRRESGLFEREVPNPLEVFWNRFVAAEPRSFLQRVQFRLPDGTPLPWARLVRFALEAWLSTRSVRFVLFAAPAVLLLCGSLLLTLRIPRERAGLLKLADTQLAAALSDGSWVLAEQSFRVLEGYGEGSPLVRFRFAQALWLAGERERAWGEMLQLADAGESGLAAAQLWLVERSLEPEPFRVLSAVEQLQRLESALRTETGDAEIYRRLAELQLRSGESLLAERHLQRAAELNPVYVNSLFRLRGRLGRLRLPDELWSRRVQQLQAQVESASAGTAESLQLAELFVLGRQTKQAEQVLRAALKRSPAEDLQRSLSELLAGRVRAQLDGVDFDGRAAVREAEEAIELWPVGAVAVRVAARLQLSGLSLKEATREKLSAAWLADTAAVGGQESAEDLQMLRVIVRVLGTKFEAAELDSSAIKVTADGPLLVSLLAQRGAVEGADELTNRMLEQLQTVPASQSQQLLRLELLLAAGRYAELRAEAERLRGADGVSESAAEAILGMSFLNEYDERAGRPRRGVERMMRWLPQEPSAAEGMAQLQLLRQGLAIADVRTRVIDRLCRMVLAGGVTGEQAERELTGLRAAGISAEYLLGRVGDVAAAVGRYEQAVPWQRQALAAASRRGFLRLNNLAICLLRAEGAKAADECQQLVEEALQLSENHPQLLATRGEILLRRGQYVRARDDFEASLAVAPGSAEVWGLLAESCRLAGDLVSAERALRERRRIEAEAADVD